MKKVVSWCIDTNVRKKLVEKARDNSISQSSLVETMIAKCLDIEYDFLETRGRKPKNLEEYKMNFKEGIEKNLFKWIFKKHQTSDQYVKIMVDYLIRKRREAEKLDMKDEIEWIDTMKVIILSRNFDKLPINIERHTERELIACLFRLGCKKDEVKVILGITRGKKTVVKETTEKYEIR